MPRGRLGAPLFAAIAAVLTVALAACQGGNGAPAAHGVGQIRADSTAQFANCTDWRHGTPAERSAAFMLGYNAGHGSQCTLGLGDGAGLAL